MIFGHLLTSSNYNDSDKKVTGQCLEENDGVTDDVINDVGGRNGFGAKLCNIFSNQFTVETSSKTYKKRY